MAIIVGVDEAGRGPWAGPVVAAAVILREPIVGLKDSKLLSASRRDYLYLKIKEQALSWGIGIGTENEIDTLNILKATLLAMKRAIEQISLVPDEVWVDGIHAPNIPYKVKTFIGGDRLYGEISAASILAKVFRDQLMVAYDQQYPGYGFARHKGYGTAMHKKALYSLGVSPIHRKSFAPVYKLLHK